MSTDLTEAHVVMVPHTGELLDLTNAPPEGLAFLLDELKDYKSRVREFEGEVFAVLVAEMDRRRKWTLAAGDFKLSAKSDQPEVEYDADALAAVLTPFVEDGTIAPEAMDEAVEPVLTLKVRKAGINALRKNPALAEVIDACGTERPPEGRRVQVSRKGAK